MNGWKLVPVEPTEEMIEAALKSDNWAFMEGQDQWRDRPHIWEAMLAAAPLPPSAGGEPRHLTEPEIHDIDGCCIMQIEFAQAIESEVRARYRAHVTALSGQLAASQAREAAYKDSRERLGKELAEAALLITAHYTSYMSAVGLLRRIAKPMECGCKPCTGDCNSEASKAFAFDEIQDEASTFLSNLEAEENGK